MFGNCGMRSVFFRDSHSEFPVNGETSFCLKHISQEMKVVHQSNHAKVAIPVL